MNINKSHVLKTLASGKPLFDNALPEPTIIWPTTGLETELGVAEENDKGGSLIIHKHPESEWSENGGRTYVDLEVHLEACTPECSNPLAVALYQYSMWQDAYNKKYSPRLYANNRGKVYSAKSPLEMTFGCHENYASSLAIKDRAALIPFLVARTLITGSGFYNQYGQFEISQRAPFIRLLTGENTQNDRAFLGSRSDSGNDDIHPNAAYLKRIHLILGDTNICQVPTFLKMAMTALAIKLLEAGQFPTLPHSESYVENLHDLNLIAQDWVELEKIGGIEDSSLPKISGVGIIDFLWRFYNAVECFYIQQKRLWKASDHIIELFLIIFEDTLTKLAENPLTLVGRLDWVTKLEMFRQATKENGGKPDKQFNHHFDTGYHLIGPDGGYEALCELNVMERLFSEELIAKRMSIPPMDTRAYFRGRMVRFCNGRGLGNVQLSSCAWNKCEVKFKRGGKEHKPTFDLPIASNAYSTELSAFINQF